MLRPETKKKNDDHANKNKNVKFVSSMPMDMPLAGDTMTNVNSMHNNAQFACFNIDMIPMHTRYL